MYGTIGWHLG